MDAIAGRVAVALASQVRSVQRDGEELTAGQCTEILADRRDRGRALASDMLPSILGREDNAYLHSESAFGFPAFGMRSRLPLMLAFGFDLGSALHRVSGARPAAEPQAGELCALFNLGISLFDRVCDDLGATDQLVQELGADMVRELFRDPGRCQELHTVADDTAGAELRVLLKIVSHFYDVLHGYRPQADRADWDRLGSLLTQAYEAELQAARTHRSNETTAAQAMTAQTKSAIPFEIMTHLARISEPTIPPSRREAATELGQLIGCVFWLLDDLVDLVTDLRSGRLNVIVTYAAGSRPAQLRHDHAEVAKAVIEGNLIELAADCAGDTLRHALGLLRALDHGPHRFDRLLLAYVVGATR